MKLKRHLRTLIGLGLCMSITLTTALPVSAASNKLYVTGIPSNDALNIRNWETNEVIARLKNGEAVTKKKDLKWKKGWVLVETESGVIGICNESYLSEKENISSNTNTTAGTNTIVSANKKTIAKTIELRYGASTRHKIYKTVSPGTEIDLIAIEGEWAKVKFESKILYCPKYYIKDFNKSTISNSVQSNTAQNDKVNSSVTNSSATNSTTTNNTVNSNNSSQNNTMADTKICISKASVTTTKSGEDSIYNATLALMKMNNYQVKPNEEFSFYKAIGTVDAAHGFKYSVVLKNGLKDIGMGGGICLASTAVFNAMIDAGIKPTQRRNHSLASSYVKRGLDAMVSRGSSDLKFINRTGKTLTFKTYVKNNLATVEIISNGDHKNGCTYTSRTEESSNRKVVKTFLVTLKDGKVINDELITTSKYLN